MMNNKTKIYLAAAIFTAWPVGSLWSADNSVTNAVEHPEQAYHEHEVRADSDDVQVLKQKKEEVKARLDQAKKDYEKSVQSNGADSDVTKQAKKRLADARKEYKALAMKTSKAGKDLQEDKQELKKDITGQ